MFEALKTIHYHKKLIRLFLEATPGAVAVNLLAPLFFASTYLNIIPTIFLISFIAIQFVVYAFRFVYGSKFNQVLDTISTDEANKLLKNYLYFLYFSSFLWGVAASVVVFYGSQADIFITMSLIFMMVAGSLATLTPVFHAVFFFIINTLVIFMLTLIFMKFSEVYYTIVGFMLVFIIIALPSAFTIHKAIRDSFVQSEEVQVLNNELHKKVTQAVRETQRKDKLLQEQSRLAQMGEMISMIAHQWRQPLGAISSALMSIKTKQESGRFNLTIKEEREAFLAFVDKKHSNIDGYVQVLSNTIDDFRNFFKPDKERELVRLSIPISRALQIVKTSMSSKNIVIELDFTNDEEILMYQNEMMQVILNILKNAEDNFLEKSIPNPLIKIKIYTQENLHVISIEDNGGGIPPNIMPNIFDPYFSTKDEKNGTGLGLYMSKIMVEEHNRGRLLAQNTKEGISFKIYL